MNYINNNSPTKIMDSQWDVLIILDACRYDYFEQTYNTYLKGNLDHIISVGSATKEWRDNSFTNYQDDTIYVSGNPYICSSKGHLFEGEKYFAKIYDVWKTHWDVKLGTVLPEHITNNAIAAINDYPEKRCIIHYIQPHAPYLCLEDSYGFKNPIKNKCFWTIDLESNSNNIRKKIYKKTIKYVKKIPFMGNSHEWIWNQILGLPPLTPMDYVRRNYGVKKLKECYKDNLDRVLKEVALLCNNLPKKQIIVSADHGEFLGENNMFAHPSPSDHFTLKKVPWFEVTGIIKENLPERTIGLSQNSDDEISIENKLKYLGYM